MKKAGLFLAVLALLLVAKAEEPNSGAPSSKLAAMLSAKDDKGNAVITPEERAYYDGLNDNLKEMLNDAAEKDRISGAPHLAVLLDLQLRPQKMEVLLQNNCVLCHSDASAHAGETLFRASSDPAVKGSHMNLKEVVEDVHFQRGLSCAGCHGGDPAADMGHAHVKEWPEKDRDKNRAWVVQFCARCHADPKMMHEFNQSLPTDQLAKFKESPHGHRLIDLHDDRAPTCISCHGVHGIRPAKDPQSKVYAQRVPETCGACHANAQTMAGIMKSDGSPLPTNQLAEFRTSVHGKALLERGDLGAPACNDCHGNHGPVPPGVASVSRSCSLCHSANASLFDGSKHKVAFDKHNWPECSKCHGNHGIQKTHDQMLQTGTGALCSGCHRQFAKDNPDCEKTAQFFHDTIAGMDESRSNFITVSEKLAAKGLDVDALTAQTSDIADAVKKSRSYIHSFSRSSFDQVAAPGQEAVKKANGLVAAAWQEYRFRQTGLIASIAVIALLMIAVYLKLRQLEQASGPHETSAPAPTGSFFPRGAIAFFVLLLVFYAILWLLLYWLMIMRSSNG